MRNILKFETNAKVMVTTQGVGGGVGRGVWSESRIIEVSFVTGITKIELLV